MGEAFKYQSSWKTEEILTSTNILALGSASFLRLDQTTPQTISNGIPLLDQPESAFTDPKHLVNKEYVDGSQTPWTSAIDGAGYSLSNVEKITVNHIGEYTSSHNVIFDSKLLASDKVIFTQTDGNEYIDSLADGFMDYGATTAHRFLANVKLTADNRKLLFGAGDDMSIEYTGTAGRIDTSLVGASDLQIDCGTDKTIVLDESVWEDIEFNIGTGVPASDTSPEWASFTTNTMAYYFDYGDYVDLGAVEMPHWWKEGTTIKPHIHIMFPESNPREEDCYVKFILYLTYANVDGTYTETSATGEYCYPALEDYTNIHRKVSMTDVAFTGIAIGAQVLARIERIAATGGWDWDWKVFVTQAGLHVEKDTMGSRQELAK